MRLLLTAMSALALYLTACAAAEAPKEEGHQAATPKVTTFLMFEGKAEEAMNVYVKLLPNSKIEALDRYGEKDGESAGKVRVARFTLNGRAFMAIDSPVKHEFTFTPATSLYVECGSKEEVDQLAEKLGDGGEVFMPLNEYPFAKRYTWLKDKYGVSWQLSWKG